MLNDRSEIFKPVFLADNTGGGGKTAEQIAAENVDKSAGFGDKEEENLKWLEEQLKRELAKQKAFEDAMERIRQANRNGISVFETLIGIANDNGINVTDFLVSCGFKSPEELKNDLNFYNALSNWGMARGKFDENTIEYGDFDDDGEFVIGKGNKPYFEGAFLDDGSNPQLSNATDTFASMLNMYGYVNGHDMVTVNAIPLFVNDDKVVRTAKDLTEKMFTDLSVLGNFDEYDFDKMCDTYYGMYYGGFTQAIDQTLRQWYIQPNLVEEEVKDEKGNVVASREYLKNADRNFDLIAKYYIENYFAFTYDGKKYNIFDYDNVEELFYECGLDIQEYAKASDECFQLLYDMYFSAYGYKIVGDKNGTNGYSLVDMNGNVLSNYDKRLLKNEIREYLSNSDCGYNNNGLYDFVYTDENEKIKGIAEVYSIQDNALTIWKAILNPFVNVGIGTVDGVEGIWDTAAYIAGSGAAGDMYEQAGDYTFIGGLLRLFGMDDLAVSFDETAAMLHSTGDDVRASTKAFIAEDYSKQLKSYCDKCGWAVDGDIAKIAQGLGSAIPEILIDIYCPWLKGEYKAIKGFGESLEKGYGYYRDKYYKEHPDEDKNENTWAYDFSKDGQVVGLASINALSGYLIGKLEKEVIDEKVKAKAYHYLLTTVSEFVKSEIGDITGSIYDGKVKINADGTIEIDWNKIVKSGLDNLVDEAIKSFMKEYAKGKIGFDAEVPDDITGEAVVKHQGLNSFIKDRVTTAASYFLGGTEINGFGEFMGGLYFEGVKAAGKQVRKNSENTLTKPLTQAIADAIVPKKEDKGTIAVFEILDAIDGECEIGETIELEDGTVKKTENGFVFFTKDAKKYEVSRNGEGSLTLTCEDLTPTINKRAPKDKIENIKIEQYLESEKAKADETTIGLASSTDTSNS